MTKPNTTYTEKPPMVVLLEGIDRREGMALNTVAALNTTALPISPSHWKYCDFCGDPPFRRGDGLIKMSVSYQKRTGDFIHLAIPTYTVCPDCKGYGYKLTHIGVEAQKQQGAA